MISNNNISMEQYMKNSQIYGVPQEKVDPAAAAAVQTKKVTEAPKASETTDYKKEADKDTVEFSKDTNITKMSDSERADLVESLKADLENQMTRFTNMMVQTIQKQAVTAFSVEDDGFWKFIASGNYEVDAQTRAEAQEAISEDGFWGVKQTSQRIFDFAHAVAGDDVEQMQKMQAAVEKGFKEAGVSWGGDLPSISGQTHDAVTALFDEYYASHGA